MMPAPTVEDVAPGMYAYVQLDGSWGLNNAGLIVGRRHSVLVDTVFTKRRTDALREAVDRVSPVPVRVLVNTHHHGDHVYGNAGFPEAAIVAHEKCREETIATGMSTATLFPGVEFGEVEVEPAFVTFEDRLRLYVDDLEVQLHHLGPAHTSNDVVAWVPEHRVLFAGDLLFNACTPFVVQGSLQGHIDAVEALQRLDPAVVVPGHGQVCGPESLTDALDYLRFVQDRAADAFAAGLSPLEAAHETDLGRFGEWEERERLVANYHRAYAELRGEPLGTPIPLAGPVFDDMLAYNGGPLRSHA
jgi:cyclase